MLVIGYLCLKHINIIHLVTAMLLYVKSMLVIGYLCLKLVNIIHLDTAMLLSVKSNTGSKHIV